MRNLILIFLFMASSCFVFTQNKISFSYDSNGNRLNKTIVLSKSAVSTTSNLFTEQIGNREIKIYPNPTKGILKVEIPDSDKIKDGIISVYNLQGKLITKKKIESVKNTIDISSVSNGLYIMQISIDKEVSSWKIIKQ